MTRETIAISIHELTLRGPTAAKLAKAAERRRREPADLLADIIERAIDDDLIDAILDEPE